MKNLARAALGPLAVGASLWLAPALAAPGGANPAETQVTKSANGEVIATEETAALERAIEGKVRDVLDGVIKADKYAVYVQVQMKADSATIQAYYDERTLSTLPGIPAPDPEVGNPVNNKLYSMVERRKVIVVLDKSVTGDQELVAKEVLKAKLALNDKKGDALEVRRSDVPTTGDRAPAAAPTTGTEDWVRYGFAALALALALAIGIVLWQVSLLRERVDARAKLKADIKVDSSTDMSTQVQRAMSRPLEGDEGAEGGSSSGAGGSGTGPKKGIRESDPVSAAELKEKILALAVSQPKACSLVARKLLSTREGMRKLAVACEAIGFEYTRQLFDTVSPGKWRAMGEYLRNNLAEISRTPEGPILLEIYTDMLAESMGWDPAQNADGPFDFLHKISEPELVRLFSNEDPAHIAFIAAYWEPEEVTQILSVLPDHRRKETILQIARLKALPREVVQQAALQFASRLKVMRARNEVEVDGSQVVARMLSSVDSSTEEELLKFIEREDPAARDRLRSHYFSFDAVATVPREVLLAVFEALDPQTVTNALIGADEAIVQAVLDVMPPKQRTIIEDDVRIGTSQGTVAKTDTAAARKQVVVDLRKALKDRGIELAHLIGGGGGTPPDVGHSAPSTSSYTAPYTPPIPEAATIVAEVPTTPAVDSSAAETGDLGMITLEAAPDDTNKAA